LAGGWVQSDVDAYFAKARLPAPTVIDVTVAGVGNAPNPRGDPSTSPDGEVALDIQVAAAAYSVATGVAASVRVYWADRSDWGSMATAIAAAAADGCDVCSISWGSDEANWLAAGQTARVDYAGKLNAAAQAAAAAGMTVFAAAGDNDSGDGGPNPANVDLPSSSPFVVGCGGTRKPHGGGEEIVWNDDPGNPNGQGSGGGFSTIFAPMPLWQAGAPHGPGRMVPDLAANADPDTGYNVVVHGKALSFGGTSAVAPLYAGLFAAFGRKLSSARPQKLITPQLWLNQTSFTDIVTGDNGFYRAMAGPDPCTGLGSPIGGKLAALFNAAPAAVQPAVQAHPAAEAGDPRQASHRRLAAHRRRRAHAEG
jgi:subtilase family serine protease